MIPRNTQSALRYLDLYDLTGDKTYYQAGVRIADTYVSTRLIRKGPGR